MEFGGRVRNSVKTIFYKNIKSKRDKQKSVHFIILFHDKIQFIPVGSGCLRNFVRPMLHVMCYDFVHICIIGHFCTEFPSLVE